MAHVVDAQVFATILAVIGAALGAVWVEQRRSAQQLGRELRSLDDRLRADLQGLERRLSRVELTVGPLQAGIESHLSRLLVRSNPFTPAEMAAGARYRALGAAATATADLWTLERALARELRDPTLDPALRIGFGIMHGAISARLALRALAAGQRGEAPASDLVDAPGADDERKEVGRHARPAR